METQNQIEIEGVLRQWRMKVLNGFLVVVALAATPAWVITIVSVLSFPERWPLAAFLSIVYFTLCALAILRRSNSQIRAGILLLLGYSAAIANLLEGGLRSTGSWYLLVLPIVGSILVGVRSGIFTAILSALGLAVFIILFDQGNLVPADYSLVSPWSSYTTHLMLLSLEMALLVLFYRFQQRLIAEERRTQAELRPRTAELASSAVYNLPWPPRWNTRLS